MDLIAYLSLFAWSCVAATIIPLGSEVFLGPMIYKGYAPVTCVLVATAGNYVGACTTYWLGWKARDIAAKRAKTDKPPSRAELLVRRYGAPALVLSWVPLLGDALVAVAGAMRINFVAVSCWTILGKGGRYAVFTYLALAAIKKAAQAE